VPDIYAVKAQTAVLANARDPRYVRRNG
jgi:hypothetical protein